MSRPSTVNLKDIHQKIYATLSTCSRRALKRKYKAFKSPYTYTPRGHLLTRLESEFGITLTQAYNYLLELRNYFLEMYED